MMPILVKSDGVRSERKAKARHGRHGNQWVNFIVLGNSYIQSYMSYKDSK